MTLQKVRMPASNVLKRQPVAVNLGRLIRFTLGEIVLERRLVMTAFSPVEISVASLVGSHLANAEVGQVMQVHALEGDLVVKVLEIGESLLA